jgi:hypothetical protein
MLKFCQKIIGFVGVFLYTLKLLLLSKKLVFASFDLVISPADLVINTIMKRFVLLALLD